jgi:double-stranded uracil-DNA glycosylase
LLGVASAERGKCECDVYKGKGNDLVKSAGRHPTPEDLTAAAGRTVPDVIGPGLRVLFSGINPGLWSAAVGHHFARPGNRFWKSLAASGFTEGVLSPYDERQLLNVGIGITNIVPTATRSAAEVTATQLRRGVVGLERKVGRWHPRAVAILGLDAYRTGFNDREAKIGRQPEEFNGAQLWAIPNPSGIQAYYPFDRLVTELQALRAAVGD